MIDINNYPNWIRASFLVFQLMDTIADETEEDTADTFDHLLNKDSCRFTISMNTGDEVEYWFKFNADEIPEVTQSIGHFEDIDNNNEDKLNVFHGIPYPAIMALTTAKDKKQALYGYIDIIKNVLIWQTIILLDEKYNLHQENNIDDYSGSAIFFAYAGQILSMAAHNNKNILPDVIAAANKSKKDLKKILNKYFKDDYAIVNIKEFINTISDEDYNKLTLYLQSQELTFNAIIKDQD